MAWSTAGMLEDPAADTILADTGTLALGNLTFTVLLYAAGGGTVVIEHRNALNTATLHSQKAYLPASVLHSVVVPLTVLLNERLRVRADQDLGGEVQVSILN